MRVMLCIIGALSEVLSSLVRVMLCITGALSEVLSSLVRVMLCITGALEIAQIKILDHYYGGIF